MAIEVEPYLPDEDYDNPAMVTDFYEFTMANCLFLHGYKDTVMVFDMFFRKNPDDLGYSISCGQRKLTKFLMEYHFTENERRVFGLFERLPLERNDVCLERGNSLLSSGSDGENRMRYGRCHID